ncbi:Bgt-897 [Blumeria graminis f. sp. tritici]|uniref:Bgt-897 n=2 Tax=Blumeria graminis f. sp. tritici TaxID=62690 RepID=A0A381L2F5_BLUGR|nr:Mitochondrial aldehyde dehydrogenase [Blumeria graminis f. sp. tritici 96224]VDB86391.1 Bgt-897 [Blumeria graminis f. sp. tritici]
MPSRRISWPVLKSLHKVHRGHLAVKRTLTSLTLSSPTNSYPTSHSPLKNIQDTPWFIDNAFLRSDTSQFIEVHDPATNNLVTRVPQNTNAELQAAVESARRAFPAWRATSVMARQQIIFKFTQGVRENWHRLAASITLEQGKTFAGL